MRNLYEDTRPFDKVVVKRCSLNEDILMENAGLALSRVARPSRSKKGTILVVCGGGNNGGDGYVAARLLHARDYNVQLLPIVPPKSSQCILEDRRARATGVEYVTLDTVDKDNIACVVDCIIGAGFHSPLDEGIAQVVARLNGIKAKKIACDIPSGIEASGRADKGAFRADITVTMGALKSLLYSDRALDYVGRVVLADLGLSEECYTSGDAPIAYLLEASDIRMPNRDKLDCNKGSYGHAVIIGGDKDGASVLAASAAEAYGAGLTTIVGLDDISRVPPSIMIGDTIPDKATAIAWGMGYGRDNTGIQDIFQWCMAHKDMPLVLDADVLYIEGLRELLTRGNCVITPHPKEFTAVYKTTMGKDITTDEAQDNRLPRALEWSRAYPSAVLVLKGAAPIIAQAGRAYINPLGTSALAKGGSGDALSGLITALLAQGYSTIDAAISGSLAHTIAASRYKGKEWGLTPLDIIKGIKKLGK